MNGVPLFAHGCLPWRITLVIDSGRSVECECMLVVARRGSVQHHMAELLNNLFGARRQSAPADMIKSHLFHIAVIIDDIGNKTMFVATLNDRRLVLP